MPSLNVSTSGLTTALNVINREAAEAVLFPSSRKQWTSAPPSFKVISLGPNQNLYQDPVTNEGHDTLEEAWAAYNARRDANSNPSSQVFSINEAFLPPSCAGERSHLGESSSAALGHLPMGRSGMIVETPVPQDLRGQLLKKDAVCRCCSLYRRRTVVLEAAVLSWHRRALVGGEVVQGSVNLAAHDWAVEAPDGVVGGSRFVLHPAGGRWPQGSLGGPHECGELCFDAKGSEHDIDTWLEALRSCYRSCSMTLRTPATISSVQSVRGAPEEQQPSSELPCVPHNVFQMSGTGSGSGNSYTDWLARVESNGTSGTSVAETSLQQTSAGIKTAAPSGKSEHEEENGLRSEADVHMEVGGEPECIYGSEKQSSGASLASVQTNTNPTFHSFDTLPETEFLNRSRHSIDTLHSARTHSGA